MGLLEHKKLLVFCALAAAARLLQPAYVPPVPCTYAEKKLGCVPNRIPMASTYGPFDLVPDVLVPSPAAIFSASVIIREEEDRDGLRDGSTPRFASR